MFNSNNKESIVERQKSQRNGENTDREARIESSNENKNAANNDCGKYRRLMATASGLALPRSVCRNFDYDYD